MEVDLDLVRSIPKIELHAHLHGSLRRSTLVNLMEARSDVKVEIPDKVDLVSGFQLFDAIHKLVGTVCTVYTAVHINILTCNYV
jgi:hypothetical protein